MLAPNALVGMPVPPGRELALMQPVVSHPLEEGGSLEGYLSNLDWILSEFPPETRLIPGHGTFHPEPIRTASMRELAEYSDVLRRCVASVRRARAEGKSLEETQAAVADSMGPQLASYGARPRYVSAEQWVSFLYQALVAH